MFAAFVALWSAGAAAQSFTLTLQPNVLPAGTQNSAYSQLITAVGGTAPYAFAVTAGTLPIGLILDPSGLLQGTPTTPGSSTFTVTATDAFGNPGFREYTFSIGTPGLLTINPPTLPAGLQGAGYSQTLTASGGSGGYVFSISAGALPAGLSLSSGGALTGTPSAGGTFNFTAFVRDSNGNTGTRAYTLNIGTNSLTVNPVTLPNGTQTIAYNQTVSASGGTGPYTFALTSGALPAGLSLDTNSGAITGTPSGSGPSTFTIRATDAFNNIGSRSYTVNIGTSSLTVNSATLPNGTTGTAYSQTVTASGGTGGYTFAVTSGSLPTGLSLSSGGAITGTPSAAGPFNFTIQATDSSANTGSRSYTVTINPAPLIINPASLPAGLQGQAYSQTVVASGGTGPYSYVVLSGALPTGLSLNPGSGAITGTPTAGGTYNFTIQATDSTPTTGSRAYTVNIGTNSLTVNPGSLPNGTQGTAYNQTVTASGGTGPYTFALTSGALPAGLSMSSGGVISGTPSGSGVSSFTVRATDSVSNIGSQSYVVNVGTSSLTVNPSSLPNGTQGTAYNQTVTASGGTGPYTFVVTAGALPAGLSLSSGGVISGTPSGSGASNFTVRATDSISNIGSQSYAVNVGTSVLTVNPASLPNGTQGSAYNQTITASGGTGPYTFALTSGALPAGLSLNATNGLISGTASGSGASNFTVRATDSIGNIGSRSYVVNVGTSVLTVNPGSLPNGTQSVAYSQTVSASGGTGPYTFALTSGALPAGLSLNATNGLISGTPSGSGASSFTVRATDSVGNIGSQSYVVNVGASVLTVNPTSLPNGTQGTAYNQTVTASGGSGPYTFALSSGTLPAGLALLGGGVISGTPSGSGASNFTVRATDSVGNIGSRSYVVNVGTSVLIVNPASLPNGTQSVAYSQTVSATGGTGPYTFAVSSGALPAGLALNATNGLINGTPSGSGASSFTVRVTDSVGNIGSQSYAINIGTSVLTINPGSLPNGMQGTAYNQTVTASGGTGPYTFALISGALPAGLSLSSGGAISGTPSGSGAASFTVQASDSTGNIGSRSYSFNIGTNSLTINPASLPAGTRSAAYSQTVTAAGGTGPYTFILTSGALPAGLSLNATTGLISGTPTGSGTSNFTVRATDAPGNAGARTFAVNIGTSSLTVNPATLAAPVAGKPYSQTVTTNGTGPYTFAVTSGALPPGLSLNATTGVISGTTTAPGVSSFTIQVLDALGNLGSRGYSLTNRLDPALDPEVGGLVNAQVAVARRFASAQIDNVARHLESLHDRFNACSFDFGLSLPPSTDGKDQPYLGNLYSSSPGIAAGYDNSPAGQVARRMPGSQDCADNGGWASSVAAWVSGAVQFGQVTPDGSALKNRFSTAGLTAGVDWRATDNLIVGAAVGYGTDRSDIGLRTTRSDATSMNAMLYASYKPFDSWFIDAMLGFGKLDYDTRRFVTDDSATVAGARNGAYWFGAITTSYEIKYDALRLMPYVRADFMWASLDRYSEQGASAEVLTFDTMGFHSLAGTLGLRGSYDIPVSWGVLTPTARVEYRHALDGAFQQTMYYSDLGPSVSSVLSQGAATQGAVNASLGFRARSLGGMTAELEYGTSATGTAGRSQSLRGSLKLPF